MKKFDFNTIENFDDHIDKSIPNYNVLITAIESMSQYFFTEGCNIYDLGCSTGKLLKSLKTKCHKIGYDIASLIPDDPDSDIEWVKADLHKDLNIQNACIVYSIFTMQFLKPSERINYLTKIYNGLNYGGALIICEKVYQESGMVQEIITFSHYDFKLNNFKSDDIIAKEKDLRYIMKPSGNNELEKLLRSVGFSIIADFWQMFNFKGIIAIKK